MASRPIPYLSEDDRRRIEVFKHLTGSDKVNIAMRITEMVKEALLKNLRMRFNGHEALAQREFKRIWLGDELFAEVEPFLR